MKSFFIKDFILIQNFHNTATFNGYSRVAIYNDTILFFKKAKQNATLIVNQNKNLSVLLFNNPFFPLFKYTCNNKTIITTNYSLLFELKTELTINQKNIIEFILFNTIITGKTFHNEVERVFNINKIYIYRNNIQFKYFDKQPHRESLFDIFYKKIGKLTSKTILLKHGVFLSGGAESRINAAITQYYGLQKEFITWGHPEDKEYKIANKISRQLKTKHINIRPNPSDLPYKELLFKTGFLVNMQYAYRYAAVKHLFENYQYDIIWTGWGDINGYPTMYQPSELFTDFYLGLYKGAKRYPNGWNHDWLATYKLENNKLYNHITQYPTIETFFEIKKKELAPHIFGQLLAAENQLITVIPPWFSPQIYYAVHQEEMNNTTLIKNKKARTIWKGELYYRLLKNYCPTLNNIIHSKGYYPWMVQKKYGLVGLLIAAIMKKSMSYKQFPFDPVENKDFLKKNLRQVAESNKKIFNKYEIAKMVSNSDFWSGNDILEIFKIIQVSWFLDKQ